MEDTRYFLGTTALRVSPIGLGCWQFSGGKGFAGGYWSAIPQERVNTIVAASLEGGISWFDTAEAYGRGRSERALADALQAANARPREPSSNEGPLIATKWMPFVRFARSIGKTFPAREAHLAPYRVDLHQIHAPASLSSLERQMDAMGELLESGRIRAIGVSNFSAAQMRGAHDHLVARGHALATNQVRYSLLDRRIERNGVLATAKELGVTIIAYSPLEQGILTGKFHRREEERERLSGPRRFLPSFRTRGLERTLPLVSLLEEIGEAHEASAAQIALAWTIRRHGESVVAIPGASSESQARGNAGAMAIALNEDELDRLAAAADRVAG